METDEALARSCPTHGELQPRAAPHDANTSRAIELSDVALLPPPI